MVEAGCRKYKIEVGEDGQLFAIRDDGEKEIVRFAEPREDAPPPSFEGCVIDTNAPAFSRRCKLCNKVVFVGDFTGDEHG